jgi:hypothetical protein
MDRLQIEIRALKFIQLASHLHQESCQAHGANCRRLQARAARCEKIAEKYLKRVNDGKYHTKSVGRKIQTH